MENGFLDKVEDNAAVRIWFEKTQLEKGDSLTKGYVLEFPNQAKGDGKCIPWNSLRDLILVHPDIKKRVDVFALSIYGLIVFPKVLGHVDEVVSDLFDRLDKRVTPVPSILAKTFRSLNACRRAGEGRLPDVRNSCWHGFIPTFE
ncbi:hypothetical protein Goklo_004336, partial [Gossypium klotzschianum]|nr:hypothetical protein [Gossypium klotzschianum]